jgi:UDP-N-acetylmuramoyl-L-alanyl-D-glutamate--2,6-diaminopimelate ligase
MKVSGLKIKGITANSKEVKPGFLFAAIKGQRQDGSRFIREAIRRGAAIIVAEETAPEAYSTRKVRFLEVDDCRKFFALTAHKFYKAPSSWVRVTGITGTNGKTTISYLMEAIAKECGVLCGVIGTINYRFGTKKIAAKNTTPGPGQLQNLLSSMRAKKIKYCAMEVSSHALDQERVAGIKFQSAIFTNLTQDHLDYHKNLKNYFLAKARLFSGLKPSATAIINNDDLYSRRIRNLTCASLWTYGIRNKSDLMAKNIHFGLNSTRLTLTGPRVNLQIKTRLAGRHNIYNILAAVSWGLNEKFPLQKIKSAIEKFKNVPGRLERINDPQGRGFDVFVDYAHTPDALANVISALKPLVKGKIVVIFGCGGERDKLKRPLMGRVVTDLADYAVVTSDNPRSEDPQMIMQEIRRGIRKDNYCLEIRRDQAIRKGLSLMRRGDCLLIAGKGHENYQVLKNKILKFSDQKVARECLRLMK